MNKWRILLLFMVFFLLFLHTTTATHQEPETKLSAEDPEKLFHSSESQVDILHISDDDEYILEWSVRSKTFSMSAFQQGFAVLFEDGYLKDFASAWTEHNDELHLLKQTSSEDSSRYNLLTFHYTKQAPVFSFTWSTDTLYVLDTPMTELHSFKRARNEEDKKSKSILDAVIKQQQDHIERIIREKTDITDSTVLFPLSDVVKWKQLTDPSNDDHLPQEKLEEMWGNIYTKLIAVNSQTRSEKKKGMPFIAWDSQKNKLSLIIHYSQF